MKNPIGLFLIESFLRKSHSRDFVLLLRLFLFYLFLRSFLLFALIVLPSTDPGSRSSIFLSTHFTLSAELSLLSFAHQLSALFIASSNGRKTQSPYACTFSACGFLHRALQCAPMYALYCPRDSLPADPTGRLRKYGNYNCARLMTRPVRELVLQITRARGIRVRAGGIYDRR